MRSFHCTRALLLWCCFFGLLLAFLSRYGVLPEADPNADYLSGLYERTRTNGLYQAMIAVFVGCAAYGVALIGTLVRWTGARMSGLGEEEATRRGWLASLVGLPRTGPVSPEWPSIGPVGLQLAANPIRDAAVVFPAVGFIGTVVGVSLAISGLDTVILTGETRPLLDGLRVAFDTTLLGLVASVVLTALLYLVQSRSVILQALTGLP